MNTGYILWFGALVVVTGATLLWLAIGSVPEVKPDPGPPEPGEPDGAGPGAAMWPEDAPGPEEAPEPPSEAAGEDGIAGPA